MSVKTKKLPREIKVMGATLRRHKKCTDDRDIDSFEKNVYRFKRCHLTRDFFNDIYVSIERSIDPRERPRGRRHTVITMSHFGQDQCAHKSKKYDWMVSNEKLEEKIILLIKRTSQQIYDRACELSRHARDAIAIAHSLDNVRRS